MVAARMTRRITCYALRLGAVALCACASFARAEDPVKIEIRSPKPGETLRGKIDMAPLTGLAIAGERPTSFDAMLVRDVSGPTEYPSGIDSDNDGDVGKTERSLTPGVDDTPNTDPDDSILAAEVMAAKSLLGGLDSTRVPVGGASFSGEIDPNAGRGVNANNDALLDLPLSGDFDKARGALEAIKLRGPSGGTNM